MNRNLLVIISSIMFVTCVTNNVHANGLNSGMWDVVGPDKNTYSVSQTNTSDSPGIMVVFSINKPISTPELSAEKMKLFIEDISINECNSINRKVSTLHIFSGSTSSPNPNIHRYTHKKIKRVAWEYVFHCIN